MITKFDKIYVISLITNKDRQDFIKYQFDKLELNFEFIYSADYYNFKNIKFPDVYINTEHHANGNSKDYGCAIGHYQAIMQAYYLGYNNVLIFEDDVCLNTNKYLVYDMLNNIPQDINFIDYDPRSWSESDIPNLLEKIDVNDRYIKVDNSFRGAAMYALMNRDMMKLYLDSQNNCIKSADNVDCFFENKIIKSYIPTQCLFVDQHTYNKVFINKDNSYDFGYDNIYMKTNKYNENNFFKPNIFHFMSRY